MSALLGGLLLVAGCSTRPDGLGTFPMRSSDGGNDRPRGDDGRLDAPAPGDDGRLDVPAPVPDARGDDAAEGEGGVPPEPGPPCPSGTHRCGEVCADDQAPATCGTACQPCPVPMGGTATCSGGSCGFTCTSGRKCGNECLPDSQPCGDACPASFRNCAGVCVAVASVPAEICDGSDNDCDGKVDEDLPARPCSPACAGSQRCQAGRWDTGSCARIDSDPKSCGASCRSCPNPAGNGTAVCRMGTCDFECRDMRTRFRCGNACCECTESAHCAPGQLCSGGNCRADPPHVVVVHGWYGRNCMGNTGFDKTADLAASCNNRTSCPYKVDYTKIGDPAVGCPKEYEAAWRCVSGTITSPTKIATAPPEAGFGSIVMLTCP
jgi:hypothetical protein